MGGVVRPPRVVVGVFASMSATALNLLPQKFALVRVDYDGIMHTQGRTVDGIRYNICLSCASRCYVWS